MIGACLYERNGGTWSLSLSLSLIKLNFTCILKEGQHFVIYMEVETVNFGKPIKSPEFWSNFFVPNLTSESSNQLHIYYGWFYWTLNMNCTNFKPWKHHGVWGGLYNYWVGNKPHPASRGLLSRVGPMGSNSRQMVWCWFSFSFCVQLNVSILGSITSWTLVHEVEPFTSSLWNPRHIPHDLVHVAFWMYDKRTYHKLT